MNDQNAPDPAFDAATARLLRRGAIRRAAKELNTASPAGLEDTLSRISAEVTAEAAEAWATTQPEIPTGSIRRPPG